MGDAAEKNLNADDDCAKTCCLACCCFCMLLLAASAAADGDNTDSGDSPWAQPETLPPVVYDMQPRDDNIVVMLQDAAQQQAEIKELLVQAAEIQAHFVMKTANASHHPATNTTNECNFTAANTIPHQQRAHPSL